MAKILAKKNYHQTLRDIQQHRYVIHADQNQQANLPIEDIIRQMREDRTIELIQACSPDSIVP